MKNYVEFLYQEEATKTFEIQSTNLVEIKKRWKGAIAFRTFSTEGIEVPTFFWKREKLPWTYIQAEEISLKEIINNEIKGLTIFERIKALKYMLKTEDKLIRNKFGDFMMVDEKSKILEL